MTTRKIDWKQKLSSRKFWAFIVGIILASVVFFFGSDLTTMQVELIEKAIYIIIAYIFGESAVDFARVIKNADTNSDGKLTHNEIIVAVAQYLATLVEQISDKDKGDE
jgi:ABC-type transport system involved in Fe-S cluster assembly fused permease/ATPase subunit